MRVRAIILMIVLILAGTGAFGLTSKQKALAYYDQGYLYYMEHSYTEAVPEFVKALKYSPNMFKARYWMAKTYYKLGKYHGAVNQCDAALQIKPRDKYALSLKARAESKFSSGSVQDVKNVILSEVKSAAVPKKTGESVPQKRLISLDLRNVDISSVLQIFSKETGISVIAGKDVYGKVTVILNNVTPDEALDMILKSNGYTYSKNGDVVEIFSSGEPARLEELPGGLFVRTFMINYIGPDELKETLAKLMPENASIFTTKGSKTVVVRGSASDIKRAEILIRNLDIPPRQVMVEARIIEVSLNEAQNLGVNYSWTNPDNASEMGQTVGLANPPTATGAMGMYYSVTNQNATSLVEALSTRSGFNILSSPKVMALNEQTAEIITGSRLGYKVKTITTTGMVESVEFLDVGTKLVITPSIKSDGLIVMNIHPEISEGAIVADLPQKNSTETTTQLIVKDGQTIIIGGLIRDTAKKEVKGVPFLMDIPLIGAVLKRTEITTEKKEVIVLITPHIVNAKFLNDMDEKISYMHRQKSESTPVMHLDLLR